MRVYVKNVTETQVTYVDIDTGERFTVSASAVGKLFGEVPKIGDVWRYEASKQDEVAEYFRRWQLVERA